MGLIQFLHIIVNLGAECTVLQLIFGVQIFLYVTYSMFYTGL